MANDNDDLLFKWLSRIFVVYLICCALWIVWIVYLIITEPLSW